MLPTTPARWPTQLSLTKLPRAGLNILSRSAYRIKLQTQTERNTRAKPTNKKAQQHVLDLAWIKGLNTKVERRSHRSLRRSMLSLASVLRLFLRRHAWVPFLVSVLWWASYEQRRHQTLNRWIQRPGIGWESYYTPNSPSAAVFWPVLTYQSQLALTTWCTFSLFPFSPHLL